MAPWVAANWAEAAGWRGDVGVVWELLAPASWSDGAHGGREAREMADEVRMNWL